MTKAETIRVLQSERCSPAEIALAVGYSESIIKLRIAKPRLLAADRPENQVKGWRGFPLSDRVMSF